MTLHPCDDCGARRRWWACVSGCGTGKVQHGTTEVATVTSSGLIIERFNIPDMRDCEMCQSVGNARQGGRMVCVTCDRDWIDEHKGKGAVL